MMYRQRCARPMGNSLNDWAGICLCGVLISIGLASAARGAFQPVITEFMASNRGTLADEDGATSDWIEIANLGSSPGNLLGWYLTDDAADLTGWVFPDTPLAPGEYRVVFASGKNRQVSGSELHTDFELDVGGEYLALVQSNGISIATEYAPVYPPQVQDVSYGVVSSPQVWQDRNSAFRYWVPTHDGLGLSWTTPAFNDSTWVAPAAPALGIGYENSPGSSVNYVDEIGTAVPSGTVPLYLRVPFAGIDTASVERLVLHMKYDDGFVAYVNGTKVAEANAPATPTAASTATANHDDPQALQYQSFDLTAHLGVLSATTNLLAIHGLNRSSGSSDFLISPELVSVGATDPASLQTGFLQAASPGMENAAALINAGPGIAELTENPPPPTDGDDLAITARITPLQAGVASVSLTYRVNYGAPVSLPMRDDGAGGDALAGDGLYTAVIPASASSPGHMVRWAVSASDLDGNSSRWPILVQALGQNTSPEYFGTMVVDPAVTGPLSAYYWWTQNESASHTFSGTRCSVFYADRFYDNVFVRKRGGGAHVNSQKVDFNKGYDFFMNAEVGEVTEINLNDRASDSSYLRQPQAFAYHREADNPGCISGFVEMRLGGAYDRVGIIIEQVDEQFLDRNGYDPDGDLYKFVQRGNLEPSFSDVNWIEKKTGDKTDLSTLQNLIDHLYLTPAERRFHLYDHLDIPEFINYFACRVVLMHGDDVRKNFYMYYDTHGDGLWRIFPWDLDWTFGIVGGHNNQDPNRVQHPFWGIEEYPTADGNYQWNRLYDAVYENLEFRQMLLRRVRTLMEAHLIPPGILGTGSWHDGYIDQHWPTIDPFSGPSTSGKDSLVNRIETRRNDLFWTFAASIPGFPGEVIPSAQSGNPPITIGTIMYNPVSGIQDEEYVELINPNSVAVDISGWTLSGGIQFTAAGGTVIPPNTTLLVVRDVAAFRARVLSPRGGEGRFMVGGYSGGLNNFGETLTLRAADGTTVHELAYVGDPTDVQVYLRITEVHFHPRDPEIAYGEANVAADEFEFVEVMNTSDQPLDISGAAFTDGITFTFPAGSSLAPGARVIVVANQGAFETRYGVGLPIAGQYTGGLSNGGESTELRDASGNKVHAFLYQDTFTLDSDGNGPSMVALDLEGDYDDDANWQDSVWIGGSPGAPEPPPFQDVVINEVLSHTDLPLSDSVELLNISTSTVDLAGWFLGDAASDFRKYRFPPGTSLEPGTFLVLDESDFNPTPGAPQPHHFSLNGAHGDDVWLVQPAPDGRLLRIVDHVPFGAAANGESFGRWLNGEGAAYPQTNRTFGSVNAGPRVGPVVITEIMYHPPNDTNDLLEFVEIHNPTLVPEAMDHWVLSNAVTFSFSPGTVLGSGDTLVVVGFDPVADPVSDAAFRAAYGIGTGVPLVGPFAGRLANGGERVQLFRPDQPPLDEPGFYPALLEDEVNYDDQVPWPVAADGGSNSLHRLAASYWGNDPLFWSAGPPTPGQYAETVLTGYAQWRLTAFPPGTPADMREPLADPNQNQRPNALEYAFVSDPVSAGNDPSLLVETTPQGLLTIRHRRRISAPDLTYTVCLSGDLLAGWDESEVHVVETGPPLPLGDGLTEEVQLEVDPTSAFPGGTLGFLRVRVDLAQP